jgi:tetratricopeptide (TPR) repeat protein
LESLKSTPKAPLVTQASKNLASLYHAWSRVEDKAGKLQEAIKLYKLVGEECDMQLAAALQEAGKEGESAALYKKLKLDSDVKPNPDILMVQGNLALANKDAGFARRVCEAWAQVGEAAPGKVYAEMRLKALNIYAFLLLSKGDEGALPAYEEANKFAGDCKIPLDADSLHNLGVVQHKAAVKAAEGAGKGAGAVATPQPSEGANAV